MKKIILSVFLLFTIGSSAADKFTVNNIAYMITSIANMTVSVAMNRSGYSSYSGDIVIPETVTYSGKVFTVTGINSGVFVDCTNLTSVSFPKTLVELGGQLFNSCYGLKCIKVDPDNPKFCDIDGVMFTKDGSRLLYYPNSRANSYEIPNETKVIDELAFYSCKKLLSVKLNEGLEYILSGAFELTGITEISFPKSMKQIYSGAFSRSSLKKIWVFSEEPFRIESNAFANNVYLNATLFVPQGSCQTYKQSDGWNNFYEIQEFDPTGIHNVTNSHSVKHIYNYNGKMLNDNQKGINILIMSDGSVRRVYTK